MRLYSNRFDKYLNYTEVISIYRLFKYCLLSALLNVNVIDYQLIQQKDEPKILFINNYF